MADVAISALPAASSVADADLIPIVQGGVTKKATKTLALADLNATNLTSGTVPDARFPPTLPATAGTNLTGTAANLTAGTASAVAVGGVTGLGTGVGTALAANVGSAGAPVTFNGALGTPSGGTVTNLTGTASININGTVGATTPGTGAFTTLSNTGAATNSKSGAASTPALLVSGVPFAGTGTTSFPLLYVNDANATASTTLNTAGTYLGVNGDGTQDLINLLKDGTSQFKVNSTGTVTLGTPTSAMTTNGNFDISGIWRFNNSTGSFAPLASSAAFSLGTTANPWGGLYVAGIVVTTPQALSGAGAVNITTSATAFTSTGGAQALTLADGIAGQIKTIAHVVDGGSGVLTPTTKSGYSTITFTNVGDSVTLQFHTTAGWCIVGIFGAVAA